MADEAKTDTPDSAEKAFAAASEAAATTPKPEPVVEVQADPVAPVAEAESAPVEAVTKSEAIAFPSKAARAPARKAAPAAAKAAPAKAVKASKPKTKKVVKAKKAAAPKPVAKPVVAAKPVIVAKPVVPAKPAVAASAPAKPVVSTSKTVPTISQIKEKTMSKTTEFTEGFKKTMTEAQTKAKVAFEKGKAAFGDAGEFTKGNFDAVVESGKIFAAGMQDFGKTLVEEGKDAVETATADVKELAAVKSPTEFVKLQGDIARRNMDSMIATGSKNFETMIKLYSDAFAPISARVSLAMEKAKKAA